MTVLSATLRPSNILSIPTMSSAVSKTASTSARKVPGVVGYRNDDGVTGVERLGMIAFRKPHYFRVASFLRYVG